MASNGRGRGVREGMFGLKTLRRPSHIASTALAAVADSYVFPTAWQGTQCLSAPVTVAGQVLTFRVPCLPGQQYTTSVYVRQTIGNLVQIAVANGVTGTSTMRQLTWVRLAVTFTAFQPLHTITLTVSGTPTAGTLFADGIQHELGSTVTAFSTTGPTIYGNFGGYVERWPSTWAYQGTYGQARITAVDGMAVMAGQFLQTEYRNSVLAKAPDYYWPLDEASGVTSFADKSGNPSNSSLGLDVSKYGAGTAPAGGTAMAVPGDPSGPGVKFVPDTPANTTTQKATILAAGATATGLAPLSLPATIGNSWGLTVAFWISAADTGTFQDALVAQYTSTSGGLFFNPILFSLDAATYTGVFFQNTSGGTQFATFALSSAPGARVVDGKPHLVIGAISQTNGGNTVMTLYVDGTQYASTSVTTASLGGMLATQSNTVTVGGYNNTATVQRIVNGALSHVAIWNRVISAAEVTDLWNAGSGYPGETSGARVARYLGYEWIGPTAIDTGASTMGVSSLNQNTTLLDALQSVATTENGVPFVDGFGIVTFASRTSRYLTTSAKLTLGENAAGGEFSYQPDIAYDFDPSLVVNDPLVSNSGGVSDVPGGSAVARQASWKAYGKRSASVTINVLSNHEAADRANWWFGSHAQPLQRIASLTLNPAANPALWPVALGMRIGDRVTVNRRTSAGYMMTGDFFVERKEQSRSAGVWTFSLQLSPAAANLQPWILGSAVYGVLGSTTILGY